MSAANHLPFEPDRSHLRAVDSDESLPVIADEDDWRAGRPAEDPEKTKRWGIVTAKPSEYLVHMRGGRIRRRSTGQGASCFKLPWDSVAVIPTTINRLQFTADQVTLEKVGMRVTGLAVYRIVEPEIAFRMLNFSYAERASHKLAAIMREMFVGATRRHVANLRVEDVMTRRKDAIARELLAELAPVLDGRGQLEDSTTMGWGVVLDTVEIQDVRVLSKEVFANMQAMYRAELAANAREAEAAAKSRSTAVELAEESKRAELRTQAERATIERERAEKIVRLQAEAAVKAEEAERVEQARQAALERQARLLHVQQQLDAREHDTALLRQEQQAERRRTQAVADQAYEDTVAEAKAQLQRRQLELDRLAGELESAQALAKRRVEDMVSPERIQLELVTRALPAIAEAFAQPIGELRVTQIGTGGDALGGLGRGMAAVIELARTLGLRLPE